jgi:DUF1009 family protein
VNPEAPPFPAHRRLGILAGNGTFPVLLAKKLHENRIPFVVAGLRGQANPSHYDRAHAYADTAVGAFRAAASFFIAHGVRAIFFSGGVTRKGLGQYLRPDRIGFSLFLHGLLEGDDMLLKRCAGAFHDLGIEVLDPAPLLFGMFVNRGRLAGPAATPSILRDLAAARDAALAHGVLDRGQAAVAHHGKIIGLEGRLGTDDLIRSKARPGAVLVKMVKPGQDRRFDMPAVGEHTVSSAHRAGICAIGVEENGVLFLQKEAIFSACERYDISLYGLDANLPPEA